MKKYNKTVNFRVSGTKLQCARIASERDLGTGSEKVHRPHAVEPGTYPE